MDGWIRHIIFSHWHLTPVRPKLCCCFFFFFQGPRDSMSLIFTHFTSLLKRVSIPGSFLSSCSDSSTHCLLVATFTVIRKAPLSVIHRLRLPRMRAHYTPVFGHSVGSIKPISSRERCGIQSVTSRARSTSLWVSLLSVTFNPFSTLTTPGLICRL